MVIGQWDKYIHVAKVILVVQPVVLFDEAEPPVSLNVVSLGNVHQVMRVLVAREIDNAGCESAPEHWNVQEVLNEPKEWNMEEKHRRECVPAERNMRRTAWPCCFELPIPVIELMVYEGVATECIMKREALLVHNMTVHEPFKIAAVCEEDDKRSRFYGERNSKTHVDNPISPASRATLRLCRSIVPCSLPRVKYSTGATAGIQNN